MKFSTIINVFVKENMDIIVIMSVLIVLLYLVDSKLMAFVLHVHQLMFMMELIVNALQELHR